MFKKHPTNEDLIIEISTGKTIPLNSKNEDSERYQQFLIDGGTPEDEYSNDEYVTIIIQEVRSLAKEKILKVMSISQQSNSLNSKIDLIAKVGSLTEGEQARLDGINDKWDQIESIRKKKKEIIGNIKLSEDAKNFVIEFGCL